VGQLERHEVLEVSRSELPIDGVDTGGSHPHEHLALFGSWALDVFHDEDGRGAVVMESHRPHLSHVSLYSHDLS
jgi:hypothetical protein